MDDKVIEARVKDIVKRTDILSPASEEMYQLLQETVNESTVTDIVEVDSDSLLQFASYWKKGINNKIVDDGFIPADLLIEKTIPITDMIIRQHTDEEGELVDVRIITRLPESNIRKCFDNKAAKTSRLFVGAVVFTKTGFILPLCIDVEQEAIAVTGDAAMLRMDYKYWNKRYKEMGKLIPDAFRESIIYILGMVMPAWYGMQLALLHPVTKQVFLNPVKEKRDRKERLKPVIVDGKPKTMKYVKKHYITPENCINAVIDNALKEKGNNIPDDDKDKRAYERHTALWRVIGHYRKYPNGKKSWVKPYWKGILKDMGDVTANNREIDIPEEIK